MRIKRLLLSSMTYDAAVNAINWILLLLALAFGVSAPIMAQAPAPDKPSKTPLLFRPGIKGAPPPDRPSKGGYEKNVVPPGMPSPDRPSHLPLTAPDSQEP